MANDCYQDVDMDACYEMGAGEDYDLAVKNLVAAARQMVCVLPGMDRDLATIKLINAILDIEPFFEHTDDPRANGWVGQDGRP